MTEVHLAILRRHMVEVIVLQADLMGAEIGKATLGERVLEAMRRVRRPSSCRPSSRPWPTTTRLCRSASTRLCPSPSSARSWQTCSTRNPMRILLEVGTGLGYQAAVLAELARQVWTVEMVEEFASHAEARLSRLGYGNVAVRVGDGSRGWAEHAPFAKILVTAAAEVPPKALLDQLAPGGRMVLPLGPEERRCHVNLEMRSDGVDGPA